MSLSESVFLSASDSQKFKIPTIVYDYINLINKLNINNELIGPNSNNVREIRNVSITLSSDYLLWSLYNDVVIENNENIFIIPEPITSLTSITGSLNSGYYNYYPAYYNEYNSAELLNLYTFRYFTGKETIGNSSLGYIFNRTGFIAINGNNGDNLGLAKPYVRISIKANIIYNSGDSRTINENKIIDIFSLLYSLDFEPLWFTGKSNDMFISFDNYNVSLFSYATLVRGFNPSGYTVDGLYLTDSLINISKSNPQLLVNCDSKILSIFDSFITVSSNTSLNELLSKNIDELRDIAEHGSDYYSPSMDDPYNQNTPSGTGGGNGAYGSGESYFGTSGLIPNGTVEQNDSVGSMYTRYAMNLTELNTIGNYFWSEELGLQVAKTIISLLYGDPVQTIISCVSYPFNIASLTGISGRGLRWGGHDTGLTMQALNSNGFQIDWGTITVNEYWGNFLDYSPFTKFQLYLPWGTGFVDIDPNDVMRAKGGVGTTAGGSGTISVKTNVEVSRGMCVHHVIANDTVIGSYSGSCGRQIPITGSDYASKQVAIAGAAVGAMTSAAIGVGSAIREHGRGNWVESATGAVHTRGPLGTRRNYDWSVTPQQAVQHGARVAATASRPAIAAAASVAVSPPHVSRSGSFQEGTGSLTIQSPYLIISRPRMSMPANYGNLYGYPSNIYLNLGSLSGYTEVGSIHLDGIPATMEELSEIDDLLKGGVIL